MSTKLYLFIALRIILLFSFGFLFTFVWDAEGIHEFMNDSFQESRLEEFRKLETIENARESVNYRELINVNHGSTCPIEAHYHWGTRHHWLTWCTILLLILSIIDFILTIVKQVKKNYPNL